MPVIAHFCTPGNGVAMFNRHFFAARRAALGLSVEALAEEMRVAPSTVRRWENGETCPSLRTLTLASRHLRIPVGSLMADSEMKRTT
ncbi:helix-turn-helix domain-containing protein [Streptomyces angustmyceticus]|uniref:helix-turn-helix domain-containing protein n=1 Tax=Streptomyces angustmyceticus TaxID=285578 RepID=UPI003823F583